MENTPADTAVELTIVIVSYNSRADLARCLPTIYSQSTDATVEIIVVDNHGRDGVASFLQTSFPDVLLIKNPANTGYAGGNNLGLAEAKGKCILFLNPDTELWPECLEQLLTTARKHPKALITPKLLNPDGTINACGNQMQYTGITTCRGLNQSADSYKNQQQIPLVSGAALLAPASVLQQIGGFDESYFMYFEDTELSLRARLAGYELWCDADAVITHYYKLGFSPTKFYYLERNRLLTFLTIFSRSTLLSLLPALLLTELLMWGFALRGWRYVRTRFQTYAYLFENWSSIRKRHHQTQQLRQVSDVDLLQGSLLSLPFDQLVSGKVGRWLDALIRPFYRLLKPGVVRFGQE
ncbi:glycosyltransferase family 2 protein [Spirosoma gilvum]